MKLYFFDITDKDLQYFTELFSIIPYVSDDTYNSILNHANIWNDGLFSRLRFSPYHTKVKTLEECDLAIIPFKFNPEDSRIWEYARQADAYNKQVISFFNDDNANLFSLPSNLILFRTSLYRSKRLKNERVFPAIITDHLSTFLELPNTPDNTKLSFCGYVTTERNSILNSIEAVYSNTNFIKRMGFFAPEISSKTKAKKIFYNNLLESSFSVCIRGNGNFSYRFYEALSFGRIPVVFDTDDDLPFTKHINWDNHIIRIKPSDIATLPKTIENCRISPKANRYLWQKYFSPEGFNKHFIEEL